LSYQIDTDTIRRLRNALAERGQRGLNGDSDRADAQRAATAARIAPFLETMYLVMMADGRKNPEEQDVIRGAIAILAQDYLGAQDLEQLLAHCEQRALACGVEASLQALGAGLCRNRSDRETAFALAAAVAMADDEVADSERQLVAAVAEWYGISPRRAGEIAGDLSCHRHPA
jgi:uncharacterized tellurite resistance protein B-like protein